MTGRLAIIGRARGIVAEDARLWALVGHRDRDSGSSVESFPEGRVLRFDL